MTSFRKFLCVLCCVQVVVISLSQNAFAFLGPGPADFSVKLVGDYFLHRTSGIDIFIAPEVWNGGTPMIRKTVSECVVHRHLILARRVDNYPSKGTNDSAVGDYWILDTSIKEAFGPMTREEFALKRKALGVPDSVVLRDVNSYRP
jgi:hypothetical protein